MKQLFITAAIAVAALTACQKAETTISVNLTDIPEETIFHIIKWDGDGGKVVFADTISGGTYSYTYKCDSIDESTSYSVSTVVGDMPIGNRYIYVTKDFSATVTGSEIYADSWDVECKNPHQQFQNRINDAIKDYLVEYYKVSAGIYDPEKKPEEMRILFGKIDSLQTKMSEAELAALESLPVDEYWLKYFADALTSRVNSKGTGYSLYPKLTELYKRLSDADKATPIGKRITLDLFGKAPDVGDKITDYDLYDADGNVHHLAEFQGKWMLIDFSSYYCGPCRMFEPAVKYFYGRGINKKLEIVTVTNDTKRQFDEMAATENYVSPLWNDRDGRNGIFALYKIPGTPTFYLVKPDGTIASKFVGFGMSMIIKTIKNAGGFNLTPEFKTENGVTTITNPAFSDINGELLIDNVQIYSDSVVLNCTFPLSGGYHIAPETGLFTKGKCISKITRCSIGFEGYAQVPVGEVGHCRLTFEPLPQGTTEFDFIEGDCDGCFRVMGVKVKE